MMTTAVDTLGELDLSSLQAAYESMSKNQFPRVLVFFIDDELSRDSRGFLFSAFLDLEPYKVFVFAESHFLAVKLLCGRALVENATLGCFELNPRCSIFTQLHDVNRATEN